MKINMVFSKDEISRMIVDYLTNKGEITQPLVKAIWEMRGNNLNTLSLTIQKDIEE